MQISSMGNNYALKSQEKAKGQSLNYLISSNILVKANDSLE